MPTLLLAGADELELKADLVMKLADVMQRSGLDQTEAAKLTGIGQSCLFRLLSGDVRFRGDAAGRGRPRSSGRPGRCAQRDPKALATWETARRCNYGASFKLAP